MHLEYSAFLSESLFSLECKDINKEDLTDFAEKIVPVSKCPPMFDADLTSNVAFSLCKRVNSRGVRRFTPLEIANLLIEVASGNPFFEMTTAGGGYINASITDRFIETYFKLLLENGIETIFDFNAFVIKKEFELDLHIRNDKRLISKIKNEPELLEYFSDTETISRKDFLMLMALASNPEIDFRVYKSALSGSQNIPWYIERFFKDISYCQSKLEDFNEDCVINKSHLSKCRFSSVLLILSLRGLFLENKNKDTDLMTFCLDLLQAFYAYYHHPEFRFLLSKPRAATETGEWSIITQFIYKIVQRIVNELEFSCKTHNFVLEIT